MSSSDCEKDEDYVCGDVVAFNAQGTTEFLKHLIADNDFDGCQCSDSDRNDAKIIADKHKNEE
jgi:hypothetical protein